MRIISLLGLVIACLLLADVAVVVGHALGPSDAVDGAGTDVGDAGTDTGDAGTALDARADAGGDPSRGVTAGAGAEPDAQLLGRLDEAWRRHGPPGTVGLAVVDSTGRLVWGRHPDRALLPASTQKLVTATLALDALGADHRFTTEIRATGPVEDGVLHGDLIVVGGGDPALGDAQWARVLPARPRTPVETLTARVADAGVREVRGQVIGVDPVLPYQPQASGWPARYLANADAVRSAGLTVNGGLDLHEHGGQIRGRPADSPALETARTVSEQLAHHDVPVAGQPGVIAAVPADARRVAAVDSPAVSDLLRYTLRRSDNHFADTLWRMAGRTVGDGSWASGARAAKARLRGLGIPDLDDTRFADGSGLSRNNRATARQLAMLDQRMTAARGAKWHRLKALAGVRGTLRNRLQDTAAAGQLAAKTGSLADARALVGSLDGSRGRWHLAMLANDVDTAAIRRFRRLRRDLATVLAHDARGCDSSGCQRQTRRAGASPR
jgi:D-alanyl-D-alanine carboxypeptidase/D-alanyl-D-alanine-endopeptidase (penicillin-binding protein 4)